MDRIPSQPPSPHPSDHDEPPPPRSVGAEHLAPIIVGLMGAFGVVVVLAAILADLLRSA
jgi:hypothetical protein